MRRQARKVHQTGVKIETPPSCGRLDMYLSCETAVENTPDIAGGRLPRIGNQCRAAFASRAAVMVNRHYLRLFAPQHTTPIDVNDVRGYSMLRAVVGDSLLTSLYGMVVIDDAETPGG